jgi:hypothetical protein
MDSWGKGKVEVPGVKKEGLVMWQDSTVKWRKGDKGNWNPMQRTGQLQAEETRQVYATGGEIRILK